jgi:CelD/BcsL family acetyltransferase involved in cellulose biosynthesis
MSRTGLSGAASRLRNTTLIRDSVYGPDSGRIIRVDSRIDSRWEAYVAAHPDGLVYHHPRWLEAIAQAYGGEPVTFAYETRDRQLRGILPLLYKRGLLNGDCLSSLPHTPVAGPLASDLIATEALVNAAIEWVSVHRGTRLQLKVLNKGLGETIANLSVVPWEETYQLKLPRSSQRLHFGNSRNHARIKWAVNKACRCGVSVRAAEHESDLREWYQLYLDTMRWHVVPPRPYRFFQNLWEILRPRGLMKLLLAEQNTGDRIVLLAGSMFLMASQTMFYAFNGRRRDALSLRPNDIIQWRAIREACDHGYSRYDFGEVADSDYGLADFKSKWGAEPRRFYRCYFPASRQSAIPHPDSPVRRHAKKIWRHLPLGATALLGGWIYRNV